MSESRRSRVQSNRVRARQRRRQRRGNTWKHPPEARQFGDDVHKYGEYLMKKGIAVGSAKASSRSFKTGEEFLWNKGKQVREEASTYSAIISTTRLTEPEGVFGVEQQIKTRGTASSWRNTRRRIRRRRDVGKMDTPEGMDPLELENEAELGLGAHKNVAVLKKSVHAPIPWDAIDDTGQSVRVPTMANENGDEDHGVMNMLDMYQDLVLFNSSKGSGLETFISDLQPFFIPRSQRAVLNGPIVPVTTQEAAMFRKGNESIRGWKAVQDMKGSLKAFLPSAVDSWMENFVEEQLASSSPDLQKRVIQRLLRARTQEGQDGPVIGLNFLNCIQWTVGTFYSFVQSQYKYSVHLSEKDSTKKVAVISFAVTHRYHVALFLDVDPARVVLSRYRLCNYLLSYGRLALGLPLTKQHQAVKKFKTQIHELIAQEQEEISSARDPSSTTAASKFKSMLDHVDYHTMDKTTIKKRKREILAMPTTGILEVCFFACSCTRKM